ncbi:hypothetical protein J0S82_007556, partial [Galemys pyrenaicus]
MSRNSSLPSEQHGDDLIVTPFAQVCIMPALACAHSVLDGFEKCEKQLHYTDKPSWNIQ